MQAITRALSLTFSLTQKQEALEWRRVFHLTKMEKAIREHQLAKSRKLHDGFLLALPKNVRTAIYTYLFSEEPVTVCGFAKDHSGSFSIDERCQILMTSKRVYSEAKDILYSYSTFRFPSKSALDYFTWHDVAKSKLDRVQKIILTN